MKLNQPDWWELADSCWKPLEYSRGKGFRLVVNTTHYLNTPCPFPESPSFLTNGETKIQGQPAEEGAEEHLDECLAEVSQNPLKHKDRTHNVCRFMGLKEVMEKRCVMEAIKRRHKNVWMVRNDRWRKGIENLVDCLVVGPYPVQGVNCYLLENSKAGTGWVSL